MICLGFWLVKKGCRNVAPKNLTKLNAGEGFWCLEKSFPLSPEEMRSLTEPAFFCKNPRDSYVMYTGLLAKSYNLKLVISSWDELLRIDLKPLESPEPLLF